LLAWDRLSSTLPGRDDPRREEDPREVVRADRDRGQVDRLAAGNLRRQARVLPLRDQLRGRLFSDASAKSWRDGPQTPILKN